jgi:PAS domain S-box-containing protein
MNDAARLRTMVAAPRRRATTATSLILVSLAYYLAAESAFAIGTLTQMFAPFWPPNVVLLCALLMVPPGAWWLFIAAVFPAHAIAELGVGMPVSQLIAAFACNVCVAVLSAAGMRRFIGRTPWLGSLRNVTIYFVIAVFLAPGAVSLFAGLEPILGDGEISRYGTYAWRWYLSNALGSLALTPVFLTWFWDGLHAFKPISGRRLLEAVALCIGIVVACTLAFRGTSAGSETLLPAMLYAPIPMVLWSAVRFGGRGASGAILAVTVLALWHAMQSHGPFVGNTPEQSVVSLQLFLAAFSAPVLFLAALMEELRRMNDRLSSVLDGISDCYFTIDRRSRFTMVNSKAAGWMGASSASELIGRELDDALGSVGPESEFSNLREATGSGFGIEIPSTIRPGHWIDLQAYASSEGASVFFRDITARKSVELALQRSMKYLQLTHEAAGIGTWEWDIVTGELTWSPELYRLFGIDSSASKTSLQSEWLRSLHPEDRERVEHVTRDALAARKPFSYEFRTLREGRVQWMISRGKVLRDQSGRPERIIGATIDITERKRAEEELRHSEERFREMAEAIPDILFTTDADGRCEYVSPRYYEHTGLPQSTPLDLGWMDALHADDRSRIIAASQRAGRNGEAFEEECRLRAANGSYGWFVIRDRPIHDGAGKIVKWIGVITDIDALKKTEDALRGTNLRLARLMRKMTEYQFSLDPDWRVLECNAASAANLGVALDQVIGKDLKEIVSSLPGSPVEHALKSVFEQRSTARFEAQFPPHSNRWQQFNVYPIPEGITIFASDITERKRAELQTRSMQSLLQSSLDALSAHVAILDGAGRILAVNAAWMNFAEENGFSRSAEIAGKDYLRVCEKARPQCTQMRAIAVGLRAVMEGARKDFRIEYPCHCGTTVRWFQFRATRFGEGTGRRVVVADEDITEVKRTEEALRRLTTRLLQVQDAERRRIARDLHDSTAQHIVGAALGITRALTHVPEADSSARASLKDGAELLEEALREIRTVSYLLHPPMLDDTGLPAAIRWYVEGFSRRSGIAVDLFISPGLSKRRPSLDVETTLFRVLQEALTNVHRHSGSKAARIRLAEATAPERGLLLEIEDDGDGQRGGSSPKGAGRTRRAGERAGIGVGISGMRERLTQLNGRLEFHTGLKGTTVCAFVPDPTAAKRRRGRSARCDAPSAA